RATTPNGRGETNWYLGFTAGNRLLSKKKNKLPLAEMVFVIWRINEKSRFRAFLGRRNRI
ncbi:hypothetical protein OAU26_08350, partial [Mariniblastus sp.]|nr:hypothetical protein [Mariniblastus sp.]